MVFLNGGEMIKIIRYLKSFYRRGRYGWDYSDVFSMDQYLSTIIPQMLRHLASKRVCPAEFYDDDINKAYNKWHENLVEIANGFEKYNEYDLKEMLHAISQEYQLNMEDKEVNLNTPSGEKETAFIEILSLVLFDPLRRNNWLKFF